MTFVRTLPGGAAATVGQIATRSRITDALEYDLIGNAL
jgi:hypothetical protein